MFIAIIAVLVAVFLAATGRGGELSDEHVDYAPLELGSVSAADVALLRPPTAMWGYNVDVTDEALDRIARAMRDRDLTIAYLQQQLSAQDLTSGATAPNPAAGLTRPEPQALPGPYDEAEGAGPEPGPGPAAGGADPERGW